MVARVPNDRRFREPYQPHGLYMPGEVVTLRNTPETVRALQCGDLEPACDVSREIVGEKPKTTKRSKSEQGV